MEGSNLQEYTLAKISGVINKHNDLHTVVNNHGKDKHKNNYKLLYMKPSQQNIDNS